MVSMGHNELKTKKKKTMSIEIHICFLFIAISSPNISTVTINSDLEYRFVPVHRKDRFSLVIITMKNVTWWVIVIWIPIHFPNTALCQISQYILIPWEYAVVIDLAWSQFTATWLIKVAKNNPYLLLEQLWSDKLTFSQLSVQHY